MVTRAAVAGDEVVNCQVADAKRTEISLAFLAILALVFRRLISRNLLDPSLVPAAFEVGGQPDLDEPVDQFLAEEIGRHAENVRVVVPAAHLGLDRIAATDRPDAVHLVGDDAHAEPGPAHRECRDPSRRSTPISETGIA